jgi:hypothetical protein
MGNFFNNRKSAGYELWHNEKKLLTLFVHPFTNSARIEYAAEKRVFMIRKEGFLRNKTVLRNEYGVRMGQLGHDKSNASEGQIELDGEKFFYIIHNHPVPELVIYHDTKDKPFVICGLKVNNGDASVQYNKTHRTQSFTTFLIDGPVLVYVPPHCERELVRIRSIT